MVRTRIAPSPTGDPHLGTVYTALFNYAFAKKNKGEFILRIEDTDRTRIVPEAEQKIIDSLSWLGLKWDKGPYRQSERLALYQKTAKELVESGAAYYCDCSSDRLAEVRKKQQAKREIPRYDRKCRVNPPKKGKFVVRLRVPADGDTNFEDLIRGNITFKNRDIDDAVLLKSDGWPTYHLAVVVDDISMKISHVIRAEEWLSSTPKHILIYQALKNKPPIYAHLPLLRNQDKSKISKRKNPVSLVWYRNQGYLPQAILNYLALMGWSMPDGREKFSLEEFIDKIDLSRVDPVGPIFDLQKLNWLNGQWSRSISDKELISKIKETSKYAEPDIKKVLPLVWERVKVLSEFDELVKFVFESPRVDNTLLLSFGYTAAETKEVLKKVLVKYENLVWEQKRLEEGTRKLAVQIGWKPADLFMTIRVVICGSKESPPLFESLIVVGKDESIKRLDRAVDSLTN